ncbi:hypothetical protein OQA88_7677 [Cercophora sp. LCS_1]
MSPYEDKSLPDGSIRLLKLLAARGNDDRIRCRLLEFPLQKSTKATEAYEALSYVWGSPENRRSILVGGHDLLVTENLYVVLLHLRNHFVERLLWIDAICINQKDFSERSRQVQMMAQVYAKATRVVVWLGDATADSSLALERIRIAAEQHSAPPRITGTGTALDEFRDAAERTGRSATGGSDLKAIVDLLGRPWFERIWVLQEVGAARHILIMCGSTEVDGYTFCLGLNALNLSYEAYPGSYSLIRSVTYLMRGAIFRPRHITTTRPGGRFSLDIRPLGDLLDMYHSRQATDRRDKVYAMLGMSSDDDVAASIVPDYDQATSPWEDLFRNLIKLLLSQQISVETWSEREIAIVRSEGRVLAVVSSINSDTTWQDRQEVIVDSRNAAEYWGAEETWHSRWFLQASAVPVREGDLVCLLRGAPKPTIIRPRGDYFVIIAITATPTEHLRSKSTDMDWQRVRQSLETTGSFRKDFLLVWDWETASSPGRPENEDGGLGEDYASLTKRCNLETSGTDGVDDESKKIARLWDAALILEDAENYDEAGKRLQLAVDTCERTLGKESPRAIAARDRLATVHKKHQQSEAEKAERAAREAQGKAKLPIKLKDCIGRRFSFPFELARVWAGIEELIKQAFLHVDILGAQVADGHYDLLTSGEIILPALWERTVEPGMEIEMHMWPMPEPQERRFPPGLGPRGPLGGGPRPQGYGGVGSAPMGGPPPGGHDHSNSHVRPPPPGIRFPPSGPLPPGWPSRPGMLPMRFPPGLPPLPPGVVPIMVEPRRAAKKHGLDPWPEPGFLFGGVKGQRFIWKPNPERRMRVVSEDEGSEDAVSEDAVSDDSDSEWESLTDPSDSSSSCI